ncbi:glycosyltransferase family 2 protein [Cupriavidus necator]
MKQNIVITMAGRGSRFYDAGYKHPKYEIVAHGRSLFDWSMLSLKHFLDADSKVIFVCLAQNNSADYVKSRATALGIHNLQILEIDKITDGQATSAFVTRDQWVVDNPLLIYNIDTYVNPRSLSPSHIKVGSDGWIPCFKASGDHWSFVRIDENGWAVDVAEKSRISDNASVGLYWFRRAEDYIRAYTEFFSDDANLVKGERYVAPLYSHLVRYGHQFSISELPTSDVHVLGTPAELETFLAKPASAI